MLKRGIQFLVLVAVGAASTITPACASSVTYSDPTSFGAASMNVNLITFEDLGIAVGNQGSYNNSSGLFDGPSGNLVEFTGWNGTGWQLNATNQPSGLGWPSWGPTSPNTVVYAAGGSSSYLQITLPSNVTAFGLDVMTAFSFAQNVTITLSDGEVFNNIATQNNPTEQFWGVTTSAPISYIRIQAPTAGTVLIDNVEFGQSADSGPADTPEAITFLLMGLGLLLLRGMGRFAPPPHGA